MKRNHLVKKSKRKHFHVSARLILSCLILWFWLILSIEQVTITLGVKRGSGIFFFLFHYPLLQILFIPKTIGNRKGDCAWSCSRWQTPPEKICKLQRTNQSSLRTLHWFVRCNLQIFSGCVCHLEQLHAQSPFLFPIAFGINLIPFFDIGSVLAVLCWGIHSLLGPLRGRNCRCLWLWQLGFRVSLRAAMSNPSPSPPPPTPFQTEA